MLRVLILALLLIMLLCASLAFAEWQRPELRFSEGYRGVIKYDRESVYIQRLESIFLYSIKNKNISFVVFPFLEGRLNRSLKWVDKQGGVELGINVCPWLYCGEAFQYNWIYATCDTAEIKSGFELHHKLLTLCGNDFKGLLFLDHRYDYKSVISSRRIETGFGFVYPIVKHLEAKLNWRHIDYIQAHDRDALEFSATLIF